MASPTTKAGAEQRVLFAAADQLVQLHAKFTDPASGQLVNNTYAQCYHGSTTLWVCELDTLPYPRPMAWFNVRSTGVVSLRTELPLGYPVTTTVTVQAPPAQLRTGLTLPDTP